MARCTRYNKGRVEMADPTDQTPPEGFAEKCPYCNSEVSESFGELVCDACGAGTIEGKWVDPDAKT